MASAQRVMAASGTMQTSMATSGGTSMTAIKFVLLLIAQLPLLRASPLQFSAFRAHITEEAPLPAENATLWIYLVVAVALVLLGGAFAGLTIALMGQVVIP